MIIKKTRQTMGDKVHIQEGKSPDNQLKFLISILVRKINLI